MIIHYLYYELHLTEKLKMEFVDYLGNKKMTLFFEDGIVYQVRIYLEDDDPNIFDKKLIVSTKQFKLRKFITYKKCYENNGQGITEYYTNNSLDSKFIVQRGLNKKTTLGFSSCGDLFYKEWIQYLDSGEIKNKSSMVYNLDGTITMGD